MVALIARSESSGGKVSISWLITFHVFNEYWFGNVVPVSLALYARPPAFPAPPRAHHRRCIIWPSLPRIIWSAGSAAFSKKFPPSNSGFCIRHCAE